MKNKLLFPISFCICMHFVLFTFGQNKSPFISIYLSQAHQGGVIKIKNNDSTVYMIELSRDSNQTFFKLNPGIFLIPINNFEKRIYNLKIYSSLNDMFDTTFSIKEVKKRIKKFPAYKNYSKLVDSSYLKLRDVVDNDTANFGIENCCEYPLKKIFVTDNFGTIRIRGDFVSYHKGIDLRAPVGTKVYSISKGKVLAIFNQKQTPLYGNCIAISHGNKTYSIYIHLSKIDTCMFVGKIIQENELIALSGKSGSMKPVPHLHCSIDIFFDNQLIPVDLLSFYKILNEQ